MQEGLYNKILVWKLENLIDTNFKKYKLQIIRDEKLYFLIKKTISTLISRLYFLMNTRKQNNIIRLGLFIYEYLTFLRHVGTRIIHNTFARIFFFLNRKMRRIYSYSSH